MKTSMVRPARLARKPRQYSEESMSLRAGAGRADRRAREVCAPRLERTGREIQWRTGTRPGARNPTEHVMSLTPVDPSARRLRLRTRSRTRTRPTCSSSSSCPLTASVNRFRSSAGSCAFLPSAPSASLRLTSSYRPLASIPRVLSHREPVFQRSSVNSAGLA
jgi:hypothetical protein